MPLIKPRTNRVKTIRHICRLQEPNRDALVLYARFIGDTADYVLNQLFERRTALCVLRRVSPAERTIRNVAGDTTFSIVVGLVVDEGMALR